MLTLGRKKRKRRNRLEKLKIKLRGKDRSRLENKGDRKDERSWGLKCFMKRLSRITERGSKIIWRLKITTNLIRLRVQL
jgi:hypothetical protein